MSLHSPTRFAPGEIFTGNGRAGPLWAVAANLSDDECTGDLVEVPDGKSQRLNRALLRGRWMAVDLDTPWYVEWWAKDGDAALWQAKVPSIAFVLALAKYARSRGQGEKLRISVPKGAAPADARTLSQLPVEQIDARR